MAVAATLDRRARGDLVEAAARRHLLAAGLRELASNASYRGGELDLVMFDAAAGGSVVFVEVRYRRSGAFGGGAAKLFAFGHDAWLITAYLERLATRADGQIQGATGGLRLDGFGNIVRTPAWSTFNGGQAVPLASQP